MYRTLLCFALILGITNAGGLAAAEEEKVGEKETLYALGLVIAQSLDIFSLTEAELAQVVAGITDGVMKKPTKVMVQAFRAKIQALAKARASGVLEREKKEGAAVLAKAAEEKGAVKTESGMVYLEVKEGSGASPKASDRVKVHYHGTLRDGTVFDSSVQRNEPATFGLDRVIPCWTEGVQRMKVGGKAKLVCPSTLAYGDRGSPPNIRPGAVLTFEVELLEITK
jgi:FKBP-type peptidyl-prolyl cis-trans isomerase FkpA/FKBP-type peptidyl-prolyl cis-trans isomerase FklB